MKQKNSSDESSGHHNQMEIHKIGFRKVIITTNIEMSKKEYNKMVITIENTFPKYKFAFINGDL